MWLLAWLLTLPSGGLVALFTSVYFSGLTYRPSSLCPQGSTR